MVSSFRFMTQFHLMRFRAVRRHLEDTALDTLLVTHPPNWFYLTGFTGDAGVLAVSHQSSVLLTDSRFTVQARSEVRGAKVEACEGSPFEAAGAWLKRHHFRRVGFDPLRLTVSQLRAMRRFAGVGIAWISLSGVVERLRSAKEPCEIAMMRRAALLGSQVMESALRLLRPGVRELEIAAEINYQLRALGASGPAFETIVAFGPRTALPHARPTSKVLKKNELVMLDLGAILGGYCSDLTRTAYLGRAPRRIKQWFAAVREAQEAAIHVARARVRCADVDAAARRVLTGYGLEKRFIHSTGHGLGLEVHEDPRVARGERSKLQAGQVITIEPGIYMEGVGGIRVEDDVLIHSEGNEVLTHVSRDRFEL
jgi:Xaa-Pro aminopeptidase